MPGIASAGTRYFFNPNWSEEAWLEVRPDGTGAFMMKTGRWYEDQNYRASWDDKQILQYLGTITTFQEGTFDEAWARIPKSNHAKAMASLEEVDGLRFMEVGPDPGY